MNEYACPEYGEKWYSTKGPAEIYCPDKCLFCGGDLVYADQASAKSDHTLQEVEMVEELEAYVAEPKVSGGGKDDKVMCPLLTIAYNAGLASGSEESESDDYCKKEKCAWWDSGNSRCAVLNLVSLADAIAFIAYDKPRQRGC